MNINKNFIEPYTNLYLNPFGLPEFRPKSKNINLLQMFADNLTNAENQKGISYSWILLGYIFCFVFLTNHFLNHGGFNYSSSIFLYYKIVALSCLISVLYLKEIRKKKKN